MYIEMKTRQRYTKMLIIFKLWEGVRRHLGFLLLHKDNILNKEHWIIHLIIEPIF